MKYMYIIGVIGLVLSFGNYELFKKSNINLKSSYDTLPMYRNYLRMSLGKSRYRYEDFPEYEEKNISGNLLIHELFEDDGSRVGLILNDKKEGKWLSSHSDVGVFLNSDDKKEYIDGYDGKIAIEEYFKNGLRDSIYRCYDVKKLIYETTFTKGTGLWKVFHYNGQPYFEIYTQDGYFTDTLKIRDYDGKIVGKRLYIKDSLVYKEGLPCYPPPKKPFSDSGCWYPEKD